MASHTICRVCGYAELVEYLNLGDQPLANAFLTRAQLSEPEFTAPLRVLLCPSCGLSQLSEVISPQTLYANYLYASGVSTSWQEHCRQLALSYTRAHGGQRRIVEIGANDGTMLQAFKVLGHTKILGIDPATNVPKVKGIPILPVYWNAETAQQVVEEHGLADLIIATNVLGHVDRVVDFLSAIRAALDKWGIVIIECPHILPLLDLNAFDTIYHEHLSYWSLGPLQRAAHSAGLSVFDCQPQAIHGGTMRYYLCHERLAHLTDNLVGLWKREDSFRLREPSIYQAFAVRVRALQKALRTAMETDGLWGFGASAKGNTLLNYVGASLLGIYDEGSMKYHLYTPGRHIPVRPLPPDLDHITDLVLLAWNWAPEMKAKARERGFTGRFLTPIPSAKWEAA